MTTTTARRPACIVEIELSQPIPTLGPTPSLQGAPYSEGLILVRIHSVPLGVVTVAMPEGTLGAAQLLDAIVESLGDRIRAHLAADGIESPAALAGASLDVEDPPCLAHRRALLLEPPLVSVVVPVVDRPELLRAVLGDLVAQSYPRYEVVVVDNNPSASQAADVVAGLGSVGPVRYVAQPVRGASHARNRGLAAANGQITAFVDADVRVDRHWLIELVAPIAADQRVGGAAGLILPSELETRAQRWMEEWGGFGKGFEARIFDARDRADQGPLFPYSASLGSGTSMAFRTETLRRHRGFDTALGPATPCMGGEDLAALLDVLMGGDRLAYAPGAIVWHPHPRTEDEFLAKLHAYGIGFTAHLTRAMMRRPRTILDLGLRIPMAAAYLVRPSSPRNERRQHGFPTRPVRQAEVSGMMRGPFAYLAGVVSQLSRSRTWRTLSPS